MGVKDDTSIIGYDEPIEKTQNRLERMIASKCDPPIDFALNRIEDDKITYIKIPKGKNKIYSVTNGPMYVRRGSSDAFIKPAELMERFSGQRDSVIPGIL